MAQFGMSPQDAFGPNLRRIRIQHGITLDQIAQETKVSVELWDGLEHNDFSRWPSGIFARAYIREYARLIGADPDEAVDDFCRWFPLGDRRALRIVQGHAEIVNHQLDWKDEVPPSVDADRRVASSEPDDGAMPQQASAASGNLFLRLRRAIGKA
jgi:transcriptional regulator with XRE-family HTH domain